MAQDFAHRKHPIQCLETAHKGVASEQSHQYTRELFSPVHMNIADSAKRSCPARLGWSHESGHIVNLEYGGHMMCESGVGRSHDV